MLHWVRETSTPEEPGFLDPETPFSGDPDGLCAKTGEEGVWVLTWREK